MQLRSKLASPRMDSLLASQPGYIDGLQSPIAMFGANATSERMVTMSVDENRLAFLKGVLAATAGSGQLVTYSQLRRLCRLNMEQLGEYLGVARRRLIDAGQPDFCAIVVGDDGTPGAGWYNSHAGSTEVGWAREVQRAHVFWRDRRLLDNGEFEAEHGALPAEPGLKP